MSKSSTKEDKSHSSKLNQDWKGGKQADTYSGGNGNDKIRGGGGDDTLAGGNGKDTFIFEKTRSANGLDTILDFTAANKSNTQADLLDLSYAITAKQVNAQTIGNYAWIVNGKLFVDPTGGGIQGGKGQQWANLNGLLDGDVINLRTEYFTGTIKASALAAPPLALLNDSGSSATDKITNDAAIIQPQGMTGTVEYSLDGINWSSTYTPPSIDGTYTLQARQSLSGQTSSITTLTFTLDTDADVNDDLAVTFDDANIDASEQESILLTVTGLDDDVDLSDVIVTVTDSSGNAADATYDAITKKWVVNGSTLVVGSLTASVSATDIAGNTANGTPDKSTLADSPVVTEKQALGYVENRLANSFIGTVVATSSSGVTGFRFWDPITKTAGSTSADGFYIIDSTGKIRITAEGAASFANDAEDTQGNPDAINNHTYYIQAGDIDGDWSKPVEVMLSEENCRCDDPNLTFLINETQVGAFDRVIQDNNIYSRTWDPNNNDFVRDQNYEYIYTLIGPVEANKQFIRMISTDIVSANPYTSRSVLEVRTAGDNMLLSDVACIQLEAISKASVEINNASTVMNGQIVTADSFMSSLEKMYVHTSGANGYSYVKLNNDGGAVNYMSSLKDITVIGGGDSATMNIYNDASNAYDANYTAYSPLATAGDDFMSSLQSITLLSTGRVSSEIRSYGGDNMMSSLKSLRYEGVSSAYLNLKALVTNNNTGSGYNGLSTNFMKSVEVIDISSSTDTAKIEFDIRFADNFMVSLSEVNISSNRESTFDVWSEGATNVMNSLKSISLNPTIGRATFSVTNTKYEDNTGVLNDASSFMNSVETIDIKSTDRVSFVLRNGNWNSGVFENSGDDFFSSLTTINIDAGTSEVNFQFYDGATDASTLSALQAVNIKGGEISAQFSKNMTSESWFDFANIQGTSDGQADQWYFKDLTKNDVHVISGFDTVTAEDQLVFTWSPDVATSLADLDITNVGDDVKITFKNPNLAGEVWILDVASTFNANDNIMF